MKLERKKEFLKTVLNAFLFKKENLYNGVLYGMLLSLIFKVISVLLYFSLLELIRKIASSDLRVHSTSIAAYFTFSIRYLVFKCIYNLLFSYFSEKVCKNLIKQRLKIIMHTDYTEIVKRSSERLVCSIENTVASHRAFFEMLFLKIPEALLFILYLSHKILKNSPMLFPILLIYIPLYFLIDRAKNKTVIAHNEAYNNEKENNASILFDKIQNFQLIKSFGIEKLQCKEFYENLKCQRKRFLEMKLSYHQKFFTIELISELPFILTVLLSYSGFRSEMLNVSICFSIFSSLSSLLKDISSAALNFELLTTRFKKNPEVSKVSRNIESTGFEKSITFENVSLSHEKEEVLRSMSIEIKKNEKIAIVGRNGTGKSSLIRALMKFSYYNGTISIDKQSIRNITNEALFDLVSYVPQDDCIMSKTILANIKMGNTDLSRALVIQKARELNLHEDIMKLKNGYETILGPNGTKLSAGEKKKISLLRALAKDSPILLLDEATSSVDKEYEQFLVKNVLKSLQNTTIIMIIHQKDLLVHFDKVMFLENQQVEGFDHFDNLLIENKGFRNFIVESHETSMNTH